LIVAEEVNGITELHSELNRIGFACSIAGEQQEVAKQLAAQAPDLVLVAMNGHSAKMLGLSRRIKLERQLPVIALVNREMLDNIDVDLIDDFVIEPGDAKELALRARRLLQKTASRDADEVIKCGDLVIDLARCEVNVDGRLVVLTFREYELLKFLARNRGRVFTREALLNKVWGYDYYGGDRTVDVHIRRLRSKIEDSANTVIETVRNIGYRLRQVV
jgi:DNA-binding response OmpR family regulator